MDDRRPAAAGPAAPLGLHEDNLPRSAAAALGDTPQKAGLPALLLAARACLAAPRYEGGALAPLVLARAGAAKWLEAPRDEAAQPVIDRAAGAARFLYRKHFGTPPDGPRPSPPLATAHLATCRLRPGHLSTAQPEDWELGAAWPVHRFPTGFAVPYAADVAAAQLLLTAHVWPARLQHAPFLYGAQRETARVILKLPFGRLREIYGPPDREVSPVFILSPGRTGSTLLSRLLGCVTGRSFSEPDLFSQFAGQRGRLAALPEARRADLMWSLVAPFQALELGDAPGRVVFKFRSQVNALLPDLIAAYPQARYVFMLREPVAWARSCHRSFNDSVDRAVGKLLGAARALHLLRGAAVSHAVVTYEALVNDPVAAIGQIMEVDPATDTALAGRLAAVMQADSQAGARISRQKTGTPKPQEETWVAEFTAAWRAQRPARLLHPEELAL